MTRYETHVEEGTVYVGAPDGPLEIGPLDAVLDAVGGPSWTISYSHTERERHPEMDTSDAGLTVDVVDMMHTMTFGERFVETMAAHPTETLEHDELSPRMGLFVGKLLENLENGVD
ncbi:hypothetical protein I7X12_20370 [Halosimplex litoreum]|uniref:Uncharacterized protein n=1 Tax=Halosimplex litoreum TaxID=1198301 RepID=A0A7U3WTB6_9EURY|nr:hypothetical protein I7X12_20370 [Halosimplex litoreum]